MSSFPLPLKIRDADIRYENIGDLNSPAPSDQVLGDERFILKSWLEENRHSPSSKFIRGQEYFADQKNLIVSLLKTSHTLVACSPDDQSNVLGYIVFGPGPVISYAFVKSSYRRIGLGDVLLGSAFPSRAKDDCIYALQVSRMWNELEPTHDSAGRRVFTPGALTRRRIYYRPHLLMRAS